MLDRDTPPAENSVLRYATRAYQTDNASRTDPHATTAPNPARAVTRTESQPFRAHLRDINPYQSEADWPPTLWREAHSRIRTVPHGLDTDRASMRPFARMVARTRNARITAASVIPFDGRCGAMRGVAKGTRGM